jgi:UDP-N-acetyl-D-galactosamine dehydrogenase
MIVGVVGLGYVGLPLAVELGKKYKTIGFDLSLKKIQIYKKNIDPTGEIKKSQLKDSIYLSFHSNPSILKEADIIIVAVPTPVNDAKIPDLSALKSASEYVGKNMKKGCIVVYESTVYPGATEEVCIPVLESFSHMKWKKDFNVGYSPERINPGDKERTIDKIIKVVSGDSKKTLKILCKLYESIIPAGIHAASSIKVAEAAKIIENTQRDLNIALINELAIIFNKLDIDTKDVIDAASTKWNFLPFKPGLVGGHCIGVDPYYLTHKASMVGYQPEVILAGRRINDSMPGFIATEIINELIKSKKSPTESNIVVLGTTFKEDCADMRNSKVVDMISILKSFNLNIFLHDPKASKKDVKLYTGINMTEISKLPKADILIYAVPHSFYSEIGSVEFLKFVKNDGLIIDVKSNLDRKIISKSKKRVWRL